MSAKYHIGQIVMTRSVQAPEYNCDCTMIVAVEYGITDPADYVGWSYQTDSQPENTDKWYREESIRLIPPPEEAKSREQKGSQSWRG